MSYQTSNIITTFESDADKEILKDLKASFRYIDVKTFEASFKGLIGQVNAGRIINDYEIKGKGGKYAFDSHDEMEEYVFGHLEEVLPTFSQKYPHKTFVFIEVDCFGGACMYDGFAVRNGIETFRQKSSHSGHIPLLQVLDGGYDSGYFEPFTRDFFTLKGTMSGMIYDFSIAGLWLLLKTDYSRGNGYYVDGGQYSLILQKGKQYQFFFKAEKNCNLKITGKIYDISKATLEEIESIIKESFVGFKYELEVAVEGVGYCRQFKY